MTEFFHARLLRHSGLFARLLVVAAVAVGLMGASAPRVDRSDSDACSPTMPSCAPRYNWDCIHGLIHIVNKCDPDSAGCLLEE
jgi:hypothetical protein